VKDELTDFLPKILPPRGDIRVEFTGKNLIPQEALSDSRRDQNLFGCEHK
jgi:hypothetical protein